MDRPAASKRYSALAAREERWGFLLIAPFCALFFVFKVIPAVMAIWLSLANWQFATNASTFVGLHNFERLLAQSSFWQAMLNTFVYAAMVTPTSVVVAVLIAAFINSLVSQRLREFFEAAFYLPGVIALVAVAVIWRFIYDDELGLLNFLLSLVHVGPVNWLGDPHIALAAVAAMEVLTGLGGGIIIFVAALGGIPQELYNAAQIDGAVPRQTFRHITLPLLTPAILYVAVVSTIGAFQVFTPIYLLTFGGPAGATTTIGWLIYRQVFYFADISLAATTGLMLLLATVVFTIFQFRWFSAVVEF